MSNLRIFIAGHVIGLSSESEKSLNRAKISEVAELLDNIGFDVINPVELMKDPSDPKDVLCKYIRMILDCDFVLLFDDDFQYEECSIASSIALIRNMGIIRENSNFFIRSVVAPIIVEITNIMGMPFAKYAGFISKKEDVIQARAMFAHYCRKYGMENRDIANCLHTCGDTSAKTIGSKLESQYNDFIKYNGEFKLWNVQIDSNLAKRNIPQYKRKDDLR